MTRAARKARQLDLILSKFSPFWNRNLIQTRGIVRGNGFLGSFPEVDQERSLLLDVAENPLSVVTERYQRLGWSPRTGTRIKRMLLEKGLIAQEKVGVPDGSVTLLKLTEPGRRLVAPWGIKAKALPKNAGLEHEYYKKIVAERYRAQGYDVQKEVPIGAGKAVDLVATKRGRRIAIEVETGKSDVQGNVRKCREAGFDQVVVLHTGGRIHAPDQ